MPSPDFVKDVRYFSSTPLRIRIRMTILNMHIRILSNLPANIDSHSQLDRRKQRPGAIEGLVWWCEDAG